VHLRCRRCSAARHHLPVTIDTRRRLERHARRATVTPCTPRPHASLTGVSFEAVSTERGAVRPIGVSASVADLPGSASREVDQLIAPRAFRNPSRAQGRFPGPTGPRNAQ
jgi:hypothetical protein